MAVRLVGAERRGSGPQGATDAELFAALARGELGALGGLFDRHHEAVRSVAVHAGVRDDADDVVQDTFLRLAATAARSAALLAKGLSKLAREVGRGILYYC